MNPKFVLCELIDNFVLLDSLRWSSESCCSSLDCLLHQCYYL
uniref:Uncharacterized protein n=1 Tax=Arundo donax TaxID=35708 RepID=A0A0A9AI84_ARUDO